MRVWRVLLVYGVQEDTHRLLRQMVVVMFTVLLLGGTEKPFFLIPMEAATAAVTEVQRPIQSIVNEPIKLLEVIVMVAPVADADFNSRVASETAVSAGCLVLGIGNSPVMVEAFTAVIFKQFLLALGILMREGHRIGHLLQFRAGAGAAWLGTLHFGDSSFSQCHGGFRVPDTEGPSAVSAAVSATWRWRRACLCGLEVSWRIWDCAVATRWDALLM